MFSGGVMEGPFVLPRSTAQRFPAASGIVSHDGEQVTVTVYLYDAWGSVTGHVFRPDGLTAVPFSDVVISNAAGPIAVGLTDASGAFLADYIPIGPVSVETFEAATARVGSATGSVTFAHQTVPIDVVENAVGLVKRSCSKRIVEPAEGWEISLSQMLPSARAADAADHHERRRFLLVPGASQES